MCKRGWAQLVLIHLCRVNLSPFMQVQIEIIEDY